MTSNRTTDNQSSDDQSTDKQPTDRLFANPLASIGDFLFDESVVAVFPDMIKRSVPGYQAIIGMIGELAGRYAQANSYCYDLGCSLGAATLAMRHAIGAKGCKLVSIDNSPAMLAQAQAIIERDSATLPVELRCEDLTRTVIDNASVVVLNFTLQFIPR
ncbi:MAG: methyltransferase domain-containing protein, partial [Cellvibrionaceae bacterium]